METMHGAKRQWREPMTYSKETTQFANQLIRIYSQFNGRRYVLNIDDIHEFDLDKLAALLLLDNKNCAHESTGPDNPAYDDMFCKFINYLKSDGSYEARAEFANTYSRGVVSHLKEEIEGLLDLSLEYYNITQAA